MVRTALLTTTLGLIAVPAHAATSAEAVAAAALKAAPVWDGHNDTAEQLRERRKNILAGFDFADTASTADPAKGTSAMQTDLKRLRAGHVGAQIWSVYVSATLPEPQAVQATLEQIDVMKRIIARHPDDLQFCDNTGCVEKAIKSGRIASLLGMEGGHSIGSSLGALRQMYALGVRYMTLAHFANSSLADSATDDRKHGGLSPVGVDAVREMQRLGMLVDLAHCSEETMLDTLGIAAAPVVFTHSNAFGVEPHVRNVPDNVLDALKANGGLVMVNFYPAYISQSSWDWSAQKAGEEARLKAVWRGNSARAKAELAKWEAANPMPRGTISDVADHIDYIAKRIGTDHVGLGGDFDGMEQPVGGLDDVSAYPALFVELARRGWAQRDLEKLSNRNMMRVMKAAEAYAFAHRSDPPVERATSF